MDQGGLTLKESQVLSLAKLRLELGDTGHIVNGEGPRTRVIGKKLPDFLPPPRPGVPEAFEVHDWMASAGKAVGRVDYLGPTTKIGSGTAWLVSPRIAVTNRHVIKFLQNHTKAKDVALFLPVVYLHFDSDEEFVPIRCEVDSELDIAIFEFEEDLPQEPLTLEPTLPAANDEIFTIGYPEFDTLSSAFGPEVFVWIYPGDAHELRLAGGMVQKVEDDIIFHTAPTSFGNSGSPLFNAAGKVIGLHFAGLEKESNWAIGSRVLAERVARLLPPPPAPPPAPEHLPEPE